MANGQSLGAGDGPTNLFGSDLNTGSPSSLWTSLPLPVHNVLGSKMDTAGLRAMRLVCTEWLNNLEKCVGLKVKVDDSIEGNLEFVTRVKVGSARVLNWTVDIGTEAANHLFQYPDWLKKLKLCGKMPTKWKIHDLCQFPSLAHLVLRDRALHSNNFSGHTYPVLNFDLTTQLSPENMLMQAYQTQDPPLEAQPIEFQSLQILEIVKYDHLTNLRNTQLPPHSNLVIMTNICFILSHVKSPKLSVLHLAGNLNLPERLRESHNKLNWRVLPLHRFLANHRTSLRQLILPSLHEKSSSLNDEQGNLSTSFPVNLQKLMLDLEGPSRDLHARDEQDQSTFPYLQKCLQGQTQLQDVNFSFSSFPIKWISDALTSISTSSGHNLRYIELHGNPNERTGSIDLEMLSVCHKLEVLHLAEWGRSIMTFRNVDKLPTSLKRLIVQCWDDGGRVEIRDPNFFKRLTSLEWIFLNFISIPAGNQQQQFCRNMMKGLLGLRQLEGFQLEILGPGLNTDENLVAMLGPLDQRIRTGARYPECNVSYNLRYASYDRNSQPWSDRPFDERTWSDLEKYDDEEEPRRDNVQVDQAMDQNDWDDDMDEDFDDDDDL